MSEDMTPLVGLSNQDELPPELAELSTAERKINRHSREHCTGQVLFGPGAGRIVHLESHLELCWCLTLMGRESTADLREQMGFGWEDEQGAMRRHWFDFLVTEVDGSRIAYSVKPQARVSERFLSEMSQIAEQARESGFVDDVRLLTDENLDRIDLFNAKLFFAYRRAEPAADRLAHEIHDAMSGLCKLGELVAYFDEPGDGFRAFVRLIQSGHLKLVRHEQISLNSNVFKARKVTQ
ncbi:MAG: hypothetical protein JXR35_13780 [Rhodobacteraceae bacterium]|nr:hypothetical protein [Paracoccaceae bacterium]